jgi:hypothetical protein
VQGYKVVEVIKYAHVGKGKSDYVMPGGVVEEEVRRRKQRVQGSDTFNSPHR